MNNDFSGIVTVFHELRLPQRAQPVGYAALIDAYDLPVSFPYKLCCIWETFKRKDIENWSYFTPRHAPEATLNGHLTFALKYEGIDLAVLKSLFNHIQSIKIEEIIRATPTGLYARKIWFLYEWLMDTKLTVPDLKVGNYISVIDNKIQFAISGVKVSRQRVINNLPGTRAFCPLVFKTDILKKYQQKNLKEQAVAVIQRIPADVVSRTAAFLLLKDSKASYAIENETPMHKRIERWGRIIGLGQAGKNPLDKDELLRLQKIVIGDMRFVKPGFRKQGGFVGEHDRETGVPIPEHISAKFEDIPSLVQGLIDYNTINNQQLDPVVLAACLSFGFVYMHPFVDGNGRLHRYLIHHVLAENGFNPPGLVFPVSAVMLEKIDIYRNVLEKYSSKLLPFIQWEPTKDNNVRVLNKTADYYRYFDATPQVEFLYYCVQRTIDYDLVEESQFLQRYDQFKIAVNEIVDMPDKTIDLLFRFLHQNEGTLSLRARGKEFGLLSNDEVSKIEGVFKQICKTPRI